MNFAQVKALFRQMSGRYDLADDDPAEVIDTLINSASKFLDRRTDVQKSYGIHFASLLANGFRVTFPICRAVKEVWVASTTNRWQLKKKPVQDILVEYLSSNDDVESGDVTYYSPVITRKIPENANLSSFSSYMTYIDVTIDPEHDNNAIVVAPPTDENLMVEIRGLFYSAALSDEDDENYWTVNYPTLLVMATLYELEIFNQNKSKSDAWYDAIKERIVQLGMDLVEEEISEIDQMDG